MVDNYITEEFYLGRYLLGRSPVLPDKEFLFWERRARMYLDQYTFDRIKQDTDVLERFYSEIGNCICELAEYLYMNEGAEGKRTESVTGRAVAYIKGYEYQICQKYLSMTGLMYRGSNYDTTRPGENTDNGI
jgi:hypothetical protein